MPIRGLTEARRLPRLGKIKLGKRVPNKNGAGDHPEKTDHFVCPPDVLEVLQARGVAVCSCPEKLPVEIPIMFPSDDPELIAPQWYKAYRGRAGLSCKGDGHKADAALDAEWVRRAWGAVGTRDAPKAPHETAAWSGTGTRVAQTIPCAGEGFDGAPACPMYAAKKCSRSLSLMFVIPDAPGLGVYQLDTGSVYSILNVNSFLALMKGMTGGRIAGIPLTLYAEPRDLTHDGKPTKATIIRIDTALTMGQLQRAVESPYMQAALPPPADEPDDNTIEGEVTDVTNAVDVEAERQRCRDLLAWAHENWSAGDFKTLLGALHGELKDASAWTAKGNLSVSTLSGELAKHAADVLEKRVGPDMRGPSAESAGDTGEGGSVA